MGSFGPILKSRTYHPGAVPPGANQATVAPDRPGNAAKRTFGEPADVRDRDLLGSRPALMD
jgi:hypothetical protein